MNTRPKSVTIISWLLIIMASISIVSSALTYNNPDVVKLMELSAIPITMQYMIMAVGLLIMIISGIGMLYGKNYARILYVSWTPIAIIISLLTSPAITMMIPGIVFFLIIVFFLFRTESNIYFKKNSEAQISDS